MSKLNMPIKVTIVVLLMILIPALVFKMVHSDYKGKHRFRINQIVFSRFDDKKFYLIMDTIRDEEGRPAYEVLHTDGIVLDVELSYSRNKITNYK
jgi:hypothetical protein